MASTALSERVAKRSYVLRANQPAASKVQPAKKKTQSRTAAFTQAKRIETLARIAPLLEGLSVNDPSRFVQQK
jgi:hypothetical protein